MILPAVPESFRGVAVKAVMGLGWGLAVLYDRVASSRLMEIKGLPEAHETVRIIKLLMK